MDTALTNVASRQLAYTMALTNDTAYESSDVSVAAYSGPSSLTATKLPPAKGKPTSAKPQRPQPPSSSFSLLLFPLSCDGGKGGRMPEEDHGQHQAKQPDSVEHPGEANARQDGSAPSLEVRKAMAGKQPQTEGQGRTLLFPSLTLVFPCINPRTRNKVERDPAGSKRPGVDKRRGRPPPRLPEGERQQVARLCQVPPRTDQLRLQEPLHSDQGHKEGQQGLRDGCHCSPGGEGRGLGEEGQQERLVRELQIPHGQRRRLFPGGSPAHLPQPVGGGRRTERGGSISGRWRDQGQPHQDPLHAPGGFSPWQQQQQWQPFGREGPLPQEGEDHSLPPAHQGWGMDENHYLQAPSQFDFASCDAAVGSAAYPPALPAQFEEV
ncbi:hypothetical protein THAOC_27861 [Thalassiosira oceanica]|uniref:Uncharacterized protein n=1 Tax=Thalassiosira oceanica TaxID=159749 RepID=K0RHW1_THAOC|nr:hypothetical protein THAOC_27861 [Thalassiosira oceanica]|eukprot:EJK52830.1 hypothetical protein THAOC_27861 [Thalassiosira oceanica]